MPRPLKKCECEKRWGEKSPNCLGWFKPNAPKNVLCPPCKPIANRVSRRMSRRRRFGYKEPLGSKLICVCGCGKEFIKDRPRREYSPECETPYYTRNREYYDGKNRIATLECRSVNKKVKCKCPNCEVTYTKFTAWSGSIPARVYCESCKRIAEEFSRCEGF